MQPSDIPRDVADRIRLVILDVDGVLTDNGVYIGEADGEYVELKRFDILDGLGIKMLVRAGIEVSLVSGRKSKATARRAKELGIGCHQADAGHKMDAVKELMQVHNVAWEEIAWVGDDLPDLAPMRKVGLPVAVANAVSEIRAMAMLTLDNRGGNGAVREFCERLLKARGVWADMAEQYVAERS